MRILIVEDDPKINRFLLAGLQAEQYTVDSVKDGNAGLTQAQAREYDVIILDYLLPDITGVEVCQALRNAGVQAHIIGLSVQSDIANKVKFLDAGADDYVTKPFSFVELLARIRALSRRGPLTNSDVLSVAGITLDSKKNIVTKHDEEIILTRKEFLLLEFLLRNRGNVVSRGMILEHVWDMNADPFSNTIETHIMTLRRKLGLEKKNDVIKTISGVGYKIDEDATDKHFRESLE